MSKPYALSLMPCCPNLGTSLYPITNRRLVLQLQHLGNYDFLVPYHPIPRTRLLKIDQSYMPYTACSHGTNVE